MLRNSSEEAEEVMIEAAEVITVEEEAANTVAVEVTIAAITVATSEVATEVAEK